MDEQDNLSVRRFLESKRLSSDQVEQLIAEGRRTGRSIREIAIGRGLLTAQDFQVAPPKQLATSTLLLLFAGLMVFMGIVLLTTRYCQERSHARDSLAKARAVMVRMKAAATASDGTRALNEALAYYSESLQTLPEDADARMERAGIHEQLRHFDLAIADLQRAAQLRPNRAAELEQRIVELRRLSSQRLK